MFFRLIQYVVKRRKFVGQVTSVFFVAALVYVFASRSTYESHALLLPPIEEAGEGVLAAWMAKMNLPSVVTPVSAGTTSAELLADILKSRRLAEMIVNQLSLKQHFKVGSLDDALKELQGRTSTAVTNAGLIRLSVRDSDPEYALKIAEAYITGLDSLNRYLQYTRAERMREFLSKQIAIYRDELQIVRENIARFQAENNIVDFGEQVRGAIDVAADLKVRSVLARIERDLVKEFTHADANEFKRKDAEYASLVRQLKGIMDGDSSSVVFIPLERLPDLTRQYAEMQRDLEVDERIYSYLLERFEEAGIDKARTTPVVQVVDDPMLPERPSGIPRPLVVVLITAIGFLWAAVTVAWWGWVQTREKSSDEERALADLQATMRSDLEWTRRKLKL
jgi:uncharacterized protein involved in exopolysaccharide biosynthesis